MKKTLRELKSGEHFMFGGQEWVKLGENGDGDGDLCLTADIVERREFHNDENDDLTGYNDWRKSTLRKHLNADAGDPAHGTGFLTILLDNGADGSAFLLMTQDLTSDDGMDDYNSGDFQDVVALLTCDQYRKYRKHIPQIDAWWWTLTPWTCDPSHSYYVRHVGTSGALNFGSAYGGGGGVRPLCNLKSDILVSTTEPEATA